MTAREAVRKLYFRGDVPTAHDAPEEARDADGFARFDWVKQEWVRNRPRRANGLPEPWTNRERIFQFLVEALNYPIAPLGATRRSPYDPQEEARLVALVGQSNVRVPRVMPTADALPEVLGVWLQRDGGHPRPADLDPDLDMVAEIAAEVAFQERAAWQMAETIIDQVGTHKQTRHQEPAVSGAVVMMHHCMVDGVITSIDQVQSGLVEGGACLACGGQVVAKRGAVLAHHFAHYADPEGCNYTPETVLHRRGKAAVARMLRDGRLDISHAVDAVVVECRDPQGFVYDVAAIERGRAQFRTGFEVVVNHDLTDQKLARVLLTGDGLVRVFIGDLPETIEDADLEPVILSRLETIVDPDTMSPSWSMSWILRADADARAKRNQPNATAVTVALNAVASTTAKSADRSKRRPSKTQPLEVERADPKIDP
jgi:hypothetical protein